MDQSQAATSGQDSAAGITVPASLSDSLRLAAGRGQLQTVMELLEAGAGLGPDQDGRTALHYAAQEGHAVVCKYLAAHGCDVNMQDTMGYTALLRAASQGTKETAQMLLDAGCQTDTQDEHGNAALHEACWNGFSQMAELLIKFNCDVCLTNKAGFTALHLAAQKGHNECSRVVIYGGCNPDLKNNYGDTALHTAARYGHAGVARILISARCKLSEQNKNGDTSLHISAALKRRKIAKILVESGIDTELLNKQNETAIDVARRKEHPEIVLIISSYARQPKLSPYPDRDITAASFKEPVYFEDKIEVCPDVLSPSRQDTKIEKPEKERRFFFFRKKKKEKDKPNTTAAVTVSKNQAAEHVQSNNTKPPVQGFFSHYVPREGMQLYRDLAGNVKQGPIGYAPVCQCGPSLRRLENSISDTRESLYNQIDTSHHILSHRIHNLDNKTKQRIHATEAMVEDRFDNERNECRARISERLKEERLEAQVALSQANQDIKDELEYWLNDKLASYGHCLDHHHDDTALPPRNLFSDFPGMGRLVRSRSDETLSASDYSGKFRKKDFYTSRKAAMQQIRGWDIPTAERFHNWDRSNRKETNNNNNAVPNSNRIVTHAQVHASESEQLRSGRNRTELVSPSAAVSSPDFGTPWGASSLHASRQSVSYGQKSDSVNDANHWKQTTYETSEKHHCHTQKSDSVNDASLWNQTSFETSEKQFYSTQKSASQPRVTFAGDLQQNQRHHHHKHHQHSNLSSPNPISHPKDTISSAYPDTRDDMCPTPVSGKHNISSMSSGRQNMRNPVPLNRHFVSNPTHLNRQSVSSPTYLNRKSSPSTSLNRKSSPSPFNRQNSPTPVNRPGVQSPILAGQGRQSRKADHASGTRHIHWSEQNLLEGGSPNTGTKSSEQENPQNFLLSGRPSIYERCNQPRNVNLGLVDYEWHGAPLNPPRATSTDSLLNDDGYLSHTTDMVRCRSVDNKLDYNSEDTSIYNSNSALRNSNSAIFSLSSGNYPRSTDSTQNGRNLKLASAATRATFRYRLPETSTNSDPYKFVPARISAFDTSRQEHNSKQPSSHLQNVTKPLNDLENISSNNNSYICKDTVYSNPTRINSHSLRNNTSNLSGPENIPSNRNILFNSKPSESFTRPEGDAVNKAHSAQVTTEFFQHKTKLGNTYGAAAYASRNNEDSTCSSNPDSGYSSKNYGAGLRRRGETSGGTPSSSFSTERSSCNTPSNTELSYSSPSAEFVSTEAEAHRTASSTEDIQMTQQNPYHISYFRNHQSQSDISEKEYVFNNRETNNNASRLSKYWQPESEGNNASKFESDGESYSFNNRPSYTLYHPIDRQSSASGLACDSQLNTASKTFVQFQTERTLRKDNCDNTTRVMRHLPYENKQVNTPVQDHSDFHNGGEFIYQELPLSKQSSQQPTQDTSLVYRSDIRKASDYNQDPMSTSGISQSSVQAHIEGWYQRKLREAAQKLRQSQNYEQEISGRSAIHSGTAGYSNQDSGGELNRFSIPYKTGHIYEHDSMNKTHNLYAENSYYVSPQSTAVSNFSTGENVRPSSVGPYSHNSHVKQGRYEDHKQSDLSVTYTSDRNISHGTSYPQIRGNHQQLHPVSNISSQRPGGSSRTSNFRDYDSIQASEV